MPIPPVCQRPLPPESQPRAQVKAIPFLIFDAGGDLELFDHEQFHEIVVKQATAAALAAKMDAVLRTGRLTTVRRPSPTGSSGGSASTRTLPGPSPGTSRCVVLSASNPAVQALPLIFQRDMLEDHKLLDAVRSVRVLVPHHAHREVAVPRSVGVEVVVRLQPFRLHRRLCRGISY